MSFTSSADIGDWNRIADAYAQVARSDDFINRQFKTVLWECLGDVSDLGCGAGWLSAQRLTLEPRSLMRTFQAKRAPKCLTRLDGWVKIDVISAYSYALRSALVLHEVPLALHPFLSSNSNGQCFRGSLARHCPIPLDVVEAPVASAGAVAFTGVGRAVGHGRVWGGSGTVFL